MFILGFIFGLLLIGTHLLVAALFAAQLPLRALGYVLIFASGFLLGLVLASKITADYRWLINEYRHESSDAKMRIKELEERVMRIFHPNPDPLETHDNIRE